MYGQHEARLPVEANEFASLTMNLNLLLDGTARQLQDHDHSRDLLVIRTLVDALGRLALGELHYLPELPPPGGTPIDALVKGIIQVRTRLLNLQSAIQQYQMEQQHLQQQLETLHRQVAQEVQGEQQLLLQMNEGLEAQLKTERQVSQAAEEQLQQERRSHETRLRAVEARAQEAEAALKAAEQQLRLDYEALDRRIKAERQEMEERLRSVSQPDPARTARLREQGEALASQFSTQSERLHTAATALQTAAEVARLLARSIEETAALPALKASAPSVPAPAAPQPAAQTLSAMQMLEQLAGIRAADSAPPTPPATGPLLGGANQEIIKRLHTAATRAEDMSGGLADLAAELIQESSNSKLAAENAGHLTTDLEQAAQPTPTTLRARQPARAVKTERP
jgi:DNA repair exonuclease SbcCD ATPase subunit